MSKSAQTYTLAWHFSNKHATNNRLSSFVNTNIEKMSFH